MDKDKLKKIMEDDEKTWFTLNNLSEKTQMQQSQIQKIITGSGEFAQSSSQSSDGENLFATKEDFQKKSSFGRRLLGAFKNRID